MSATAGQSWLDRAAEIAPLLRYADDSWGGEASVIAKATATLPMRAGFAVEFGQRTFGSATVAGLVADRGWGALYMDRETAKPLEIRPTASGRTVKLARETVAPSTINALFAKHDVPEDLDCLVIDIDGLDYWVWDALDERYSPSLVIVEFNAHVGAGVMATIEPDEDWVYRRTKDYGASLAAMQALAARKGYRLVHVHGCWNLYFVRDGIAFPDELAVRTPLDESELALLTDTEAFYDALCDGARPSWAQAPPPDVSLAPWVVLAPETEATTVDIEGIALEVVADKHDATWYTQRKTFEEKASFLYPLIRDAAFANFVDIGANVGLISILARRSCPAIRNVAIEADPRLVRLMRRNFARHGLTDADVVTAIVGDEELPSSGFSLNPSSTLDNRVDVEDWPTVRVPMVRMARVLDALGVRGPTFFKVDTQGFERHVLAGLEPRLRDPADWMLKMEFAPHWLDSQGTDPLELLRYILERYEAVECPARPTFGTPSLDSLFSTPLAPERAKEFLAHVTALDREGRGWVDLLLRPARRPAAE